MLLRPGQVFAGYSIVRPLGAGGMGAVYLAEDPALPRQVALKVLDARLGGNPRYRSLFRREADLVCRLDHPNVVSVYNRGVEGDALWIAMQYVAGTDAGELIRPPAPALGVERAARIVCEAARGLQHAHDNELLHRDVKPSNLLVADDGRVLVVDFGLARAVNDGATVTDSEWRDCTPAYAAPEVLTGQAVDHRADIYSLGATLLALLTGSSPGGRGGGSGSTAPESSPSAETVRDRPVPPPTLDAVINRAMATEPSQRYQSCLEFARAVEAAVHDDAETAVATGPPWKILRKNHIRAASIVGGAVLIGITGTLGVNALRSGSPAASSGSPNPSAPTAQAAVTRHCYWTARVPVGNGLFIELPSGTEDHDDDDCKLSSSDIGEPVAALQRALTLCHDIPLTVTSAYDVATVGAVKHRQAETGAKVDGAYGPETRRKSMRWPVFRVTDRQFDGGCAAAPTAS
ncbi:serine/threonine-protein kinase [Nocardia concava]|uniref:serine/threonine-protein kinase n=1 Tax=Nocardia concava TaxID=257281 RepID=UPI00030A6670|nr:serine/threonine-protein kinase [Nocardia concava]